MYKTLITDLDGTLLNTNHKVDDFTKETLVQLYNRGVNIILATGRSYYDAYRVKLDLGLDLPMITSNGATLFDSDNKELFRYNLDSNVCEYILNLDYKQFGKDIILNTICEEKWLLHDKIDKGHRLNEWVEESWKYIYSGKNDINTEGVSKFFFFGNHDELVNLQKHLQEKFGDRFNSAFTLPFCYEVFSKNASKGIALKKIAELKGFNLDEAVAFGDGFNDVEMLREVKKGYVMSNASEELKKFLTDIEEAGYNKDSAVAKKIKELFKI